MAVIGQQLLQPESGWIRKTNQDEKLKYEGDWITSQENLNFYSKLAKVSKVSGSKIIFSFIGDKIRVINQHNTDGDDNVKITIDGIPDNFSTKTSSGFVYQVLSYEKINLEYKLHTVEIESSGNNYLRFDCIDINEPRKKMILKNPSTNKHYSLADNTLIHLPDTSDKNMILHGIEKGTEIQLDVDFDKMKFVQDKSEVLGNGKVFSHEIDVSKHNILKLKNKEIQN